MCKKFGLKKSEGLVTILKLPFLSSAACMNIRIENEPTFHLSSMHSALLLAGCVS